jgi:hypothetical protein
VFAGLNPFQVYGLRNKVAVMESSLDKVERGTARHDTQTLA